MDAPLDTVAFLAQSENRISALDALAAGPRDRQDLIDELAIPRVTLGRILRELEERGWIAHSGQRYEITLLGEFVIREFSALLESMHTESRLREVIPWFPAEFVTFDVRCLRDAEIIVPSPTNLTDHVQRAADCYRASRHARVVSYQVGLPVLEAIRQETVENDLQFEAVVPPALVETLTRDSEVVPLFLDMLDAPNVDLYSTDETMPSCVFITDATVGIMLSDGDGIAKALVLSDNETVHDWAVATFEAYRESSTTVTPELLPT